MYECKLLQCVDDYVDSLFYLITLYYTSSKWNLKAVDSLRVGTDFEVKVVWIIKVAIVVRWKFRICDIDWR